MYTLTEIINSFKDTAKKLNFEARPAGGLISPYFEGEFNLSAGHQYVIPILTSQENVDLQRISIIEKCFRRTDFGRVGCSNFHLLLFEMGVIGLLGRLTADNSIKYVINKVLEFTFKWLHEELSLIKSEFLYTICKEADVFGEKFLEDKISLECLRKYGVPDKQILPVKGRRNFLYSEGLNRPAGYSIEVFYKSNDIFTEIASINIYTRIFKDGSLIPTTNIACGNGFGLERLLCVLNSNKSIFDTEIFSSLLNYFTNFFIDEKEILLSKDKINLIMELLRSSTFIIGEGQCIDNSGRGKILKYLLKQMFSEIHYLHLPIQQVINQAITIICKTYESRYPGLEEKEEIIKEVILSYMEAMNG